MTRSCHRRRPSTRRPWSHGLSSLLTALSWGMFAVASERAASGEDGATGEDAATKEDAAT